jgi:hypothetical protein
MAYIFNFLLDKVSRKARDVHRVDRKRITLDKREKYSTHERDVIVSNKGRSVQSQIRGLFSE